MAGSSPATPATGLGKSLAAGTLPLLWLGFKFEAKLIEVGGSVLIAAPGDLHDQLRGEFKKFHGIVPKPIDDQAALMRLMNNGRRRSLPPGFYITSYTKLAVNGVRKLSALEKCGTESAVDALNLTLADLQHFYDERGRNYKDASQSLKFIWREPATRGSSSTAGRLVKSGMGLNAFTARPWPTSARICSSVSSLMKA